MAKHLIVISNDAMVGEDLAIAANYPNFRRLLDWNCRVERVTTVYPALTHPVHASLITGCPAGKTGITTNEIFVPGETDTPWNNFLSQIRCDTVFHAAARAGLTTCAARWPVTAGEGPIDYLLPEVIEDPPKGDVTGFYRELGCSGMLDIILRHAHEADDLPRHPYYDRMGVRCLCDVIREKKPALAMTHLGLPDAERHATGVFSEKLEEAYRDTDEMIGWIFDAVRDAGIWDETDFLLVSDHGQLGIVRQVALNALFLDRGYITEDADGRVTDWKIMAHSAGLSAQVYVSRPEFEPEAESLLRGMAADGLYGFSEVLTRSEAEARYGLSGGFSFVLETDGYTSFSNARQRPFVQHLKPEDEKLHRASHGHMPEKGPQPPLIVMGPSFRKNTVIPHASILDEAPTIARVLGFSLPDAEGRVLEELLA